MKKRHRKVKIRRKNPFWAIFFSLLVFTSGWYGNIVTTGLASATVSGPLPLPRFETTGKSGLLKLSQGSLNILGADTINHQEYLNRINDERTKTGAGALRMNRQLARAAQKRAEIIVKYQNFSHFDPYEGIVMETAINETGYRYAYASENIGMGGLSAGDFVYGFMHSTAHRNNLLDPMLTDTGIGISSGPYDRYYVTVLVQLFAVPGGETESLGYTPEDRNFYRTRITYLQNELNPFTWAIGRIFDPESYSGIRQKQLVRQLETLRTIYGIMEKEKPLTPAHLAMIGEFNGNL